MKRYIIIAVIFVIFTCLFPQLYAAQQTPNYYYHHNQIIAIDMPLGEEESFFIAGNSRVGAMVQPHVGAKKTQNFSLLLDNGKSHIMTISLDLLSQQKQVMSMTTDYRPYGASNKLTVWV